MSLRAPMELGRACTPKYALRHAGVAISTDEETALRLRLAHDDLPNQANAGENSCLATY